MSLKSMLSNVHDQETLLYSLYGNLRLGGIGVSVVVGKPPSSNQELPLIRKLHPFTQGGPVDILL